MRARLLHLYAELMCRGIWTARKVFPPGNDIPVPNFLRRDWEWQGWHFCEACRREGKHRFIAWADEDVTTAECPHCHLEATL